MGDIIIGGDARLENGTAGEDVVVEKIEKVEMMEEDGSISISVEAENSIYLITEKFSLPKEL